MGICKCRVVTSLFCFQHRINVCEDCMVKEHATCVVRTYLQWLQDNDFDPACKLCHDALSNGAPTVRLMCHDVFHSQCLNNYVLTTFSSDTAPAGYTCPICSGKTIVPSDNAGGPVAVSLRSFVAQAPWSALHRSVPLPLAASAEHSSSSSLPPSSSSLPPSSTSLPSSLPPPSLPTTTTTTTPPSSAPLPSPAIRADRSRSVLPPPVVSMATTTTTTTTTTTSNANSSSGVSSAAAAPPQFTATTDGVVSRKNAGSTAVTIPDDEDKYARRPANAWFAQLVGNRVPVNRPVDPNAQLKKSAVLLVLLVIAIITLIEVLTRARPSGEDDPLLDPNLNPNIRTS